MSRAKVHDLQSDNYVYQKGTIVHMGSQTSELKSQMVVVLETVFLGK